MAERSSRRLFLRHGLQSIARNAIDAAGALRGHGKAVERSVLRPPGAIAEADFLDTCYRCGNCVEACPANAIRPLASADEALHGTPYIDPDISPCVICDELACMPACPSGALKVVAAPTMIRMGTARVMFDLCSRTHGDECTVCVDMCPIGKNAITVGGDGAIAVHQNGCTGCGVCQQQCPARPRAIHIMPVQAE